MVIDFHAHIMPECDHGCSDITEAKIQLELAYKAGVELIVATPHFYPDKETLNRFLKRRKDSEEELKSLAVIKPKVLTGAEATLCKGMDRLEGIEELCISGTKCILIEMPFTVWDSEYVDTIKAIRDRLGLIPVMAHIDRYPIKETEKLLEIGVCCQLNAGGIRRLLHRRQLFKWVDEGHIFALGSDIHGVKHGYKDYEKARRLLGSKRFEIIMQNSNALLSENEAMQLMDNGI